MTIGLTANNTDICPGASVKIVPSAAVPDNAAYQWTINDKPISAGPALEFGATGREPGSYKVAVTIQAPEYNDASAATTMTVRAYAPPTGTVQASPPEIWAGQTATIAANFTPGQCGGALEAPVITSSEGSINGTQFETTGIQFDPANNAEQRKTVTIMAKVSDGTGSGSAETTVVVKKAALLAARRLPDIIFPGASARVNNCGKRVLLEELKTAMEADPSGKVVLVGHVSEKEASKAGLDQKRAMNAAAVISAGQGVCHNFPAGQILIGAAGSTDNGVDYQSHFCGTTNEAPGSRIRESESDAKYRRVEVWFVPAGGVLPNSGKEGKPADSLSVSALGCPK